MLSYEFPPLGGGGSRVVYGLTKELVKTGYKVDLVTMGYKGLRKFEDLGGVKIHRVSCMRPHVSVCHPPEMIVYILFALPRIINLTMKNKYIIIHTHFIYPDGVMACVIKKITGIPAVITAHGSDVPDFNPNRFKFLHKLFLPLWRKITGYVDRIISPSETLEKLILKHNPGVKSTVIPNGIDIDQIHFTNEKKQKRILIVSRIFDRKGIQYILRALKDVKLEHEIHIVGEGPYLGTLRQIANQLNLNVKFWGHLDNEGAQLKNLYETSQIFVFPSEAENFPVVLLEAMAAGMAIITTKETGCSEVVGNCALLVKSKDPEDIKKSLIKLTNDPVLCGELGDTARKRVEKRFSWSEIVWKYIELYKDCAQ